MTVTVIFDVPLKDPETGDDINAVDSSVQIVVEDRTVVDGQDVWTQTNTFTLTGGVGPRREALNQNRRLRIIETPTA